MEMDAEKKVSGLVSRILKIVGIVLAGFVVIVAGAIGIGVLSGQFEKEKIQIKCIYFDDDPTNTTKTIRVLDDIVTSIKYEPSNATETQLSITVDGNENGVIEELPSKITAGKEFTIKVNKDSNGNNIGGVVTIRALTSNGFADVYLRVVVDTPIPDNSLYFTSSAGNQVTTEGTNFTIPIKHEEQYVYLKSGLVNAFKYMGADKNYKSVNVSYVYNSGTPVTVTEGMSIEGKSNYYYKIPILADMAGTIDITAKMHKTSEIEEVFEQNKFGELETLLTSYANAMPGSSKKDELALEVSTRLDKYRNFLNTYIQYFDQPENEDSYKFFKSYLYDTSKLSEDINLFRESLNYVYVTCTAKINVTAIELKDFTTIKSLQPYKVFETTKYTWSASGNNTYDLEEKFGINTNEDSEQINQYVKDNIVLKPYLYIDSAYVNDDSFTILGDKDAIKWADRIYTFLPVYGFDEGTPIINRTSVNYDIVGYLLNLVEQDEYIYISQRISNGERLWEVTCNTPLPNNSSEDITKALYIGLEVSGISSGNEAGELKVFQSFTRVSIDYTDYSFKSESGASRISLNTLSDMTINTNLANVGNLKQKTQEVSLNYSEISTTTTPSYTSIMYFVESSSNKLADDVSKVATRGKYNFVTFDNAHSNTATKIKSTNGEDLVGERIPTYNLKGTQKDYYLQALNASKEGVKVFAVVYLSDKSGNPIDINGRKLTINEDSDTIPQLVVVQYSSVDNTMPEVKINSYIDEVNFYTDSKVEYSVSDNITLNAGYLRRNVLSSYTMIDGNTITGGDNLDKLNKFLKIKLLKNNNFTLYLTPFTLNANGEVEEADREEAVELYDIYGRKLKISYTIDTRSNKQIAFNTICENKNIFDTYKLATGSAGVQVQTTTKCQENDDFTMIKYVICATGDTISSKDSHSNWMIYFYATSDCSTPYSQALTPRDSGSNINNWVNYEINKLEVYDIQIDYSANPSYTKLYATYSSTGTNGEQDFNYHSESRNEGLGYSAYPYTLQTQNSNIKYNVSTNMYVEDEDGLTIINPDIVDCSQAEQGDSERGDDITGNDYENIDQYIASLITGNSAEILYSSPTSVASFLETFSFNNAVPSDEDDKKNDYDNYIYFGTSKFAFDKTKDFVNINGYIVPLVQGSEPDEYKIVIQKGEYFPKIGTKMLIYNEVFDITEEVNTHKKYILAKPSKDGSTPIYIEDGANILLSSGSTIAYGSSTYINSNGGAGQNSAITLGKNEDDDASVNFVQGEELGCAEVDSQGLYKRVVTDNKVTYVAIGTDEDTSGITRYSIKPIYVVDAYGDFFKDSDGTYKVLNNEQLGTYTGTRYSKKGVMAYLLVTFNVMMASNGSSEYTFYRTISYELIQENIQIVGYNNANEINSNSKPYEVAGGQTIDIPLGNSGNSDKAFIRTTAGKETHFFKHVTFSIGSGKVNVECEVSDSVVTLTLPNLTTDASVVLQMEYMYKGKKVRINGLYITIKANIDFSWKGDKSSEDKITLESSEYGYLLNDVIGQYYNVDAQIDSISLTIKDTTQVGVRVANGTDGNPRIFVDKYYAEWNGSSKSNRVVTFAITLNVNGDLVSAGDINIAVEPTYVADLSKLNDSIVIYNGNNLYGEYIRLFNGNVSNNEINSGNPLSNSTDAYNIFTITSTNENVEIENGVIRLKTLPMQDTVVSLTLACENNCITSKVFNVTIRGISIYYSPSGQLVDEGTPSDRQQLTNDTENKDLTITVDSLETFDIDEYLNISLTTADSKEEISVILVNKESVPCNSYESGVKYYVAYARNTGGEGIEVVENTGFTVTLTLQDN